MNPTFFETPSDFRAWLEANHDSATELLVGFYKKGSGKPSITWPESVDEALCFGWIDGVRRGIDAERYSIRFTPRKTTSTWSAVNLKRVPELIELGRMQPAGLRAYENRKAANSEIYSHEQPKETLKLDEPSENQLKANSNAWEFFQAQAPSYQRAVSWWIISAKKEETRQKRLAQLIEDSANQRRVAQFVSPNKR